MVCEIRLAREMDAEAISNVIIAALRETNAKDYPSEIINRVVDNFSPAAVREFLGFRMVFVAVEGATIVGTASLDGTVVRAVFVSPSEQKQGIGSKLMAEIESAARANGIVVLSVPSSVTAQPFYAKLGFEAVEDSYYGNERTIIMKRSLRP